MTEPRPALAALTLRSVSCIPVEVPLRYVLGSSHLSPRSAPICWR